MNLPPAVTVHGLSHLRQATAPGLPVTLLSGPGAAIYAGCGWWRALMALAPVPGHPDVLDCADAAGRAMEALRAGCRLLVLDPALPSWPLVAARAAVCGATLLAVRPASLDLGRPEALRRLPGWLRSG